MIRKSIIIALSILVSFNLSYGAIRKYSKNPSYLEYQGSPILLIGGTDDENVYQWPSSAKKAHLDTLVACGGNYDRCTLSYRDEGNAAPFKKLAKGKYDLEEWNAGFWSRFNEYLSLCKQRDIIVQIEIWATHDLSKGRWGKTHPFCPKNNVNYGTNPDTVLDNIGVFPWAKENPFYTTVPALKNDRKVLKYQKAFVDRILRYSLDFDNIIYCMDNEYFPVQPVEWPRYWIEYVKGKAAAKGKSVLLGQMFQNRHINQLEKTEIYAVNHPSIFNFIDFSPHNFLRTRTEQVHWDDIVFAKNEAQKNVVRPLLIDKIYGADSGVDRNMFNESREGVDRFWRFIFAGYASVRFHRPSTGLGLSPLAQASIKAMKKLAADLKPWNCKTRMDLLSARSANEAYCMADAGRAYGVFFPGMFTGTRQVTLNLSGASGNFELRWIDLSSGYLGPASSIKGGGPVSLSPPSKGKYGWVAIVKTGISRVPPPPASTSSKTLQSEAEECDANRGVSITD